MADDRGKKKFSDDLFEIEKSGSGSSDVKDYLRNDDTYSKDHFPNHHTSFIHLNTVFGSLLLVVILSMAHL